MEGELNNFFMLCVWTVASLLYSYFIAAKIPKGLLRLLSLFPVITLLSIMPFNLHTFHVGVSACCLLTWLCNFKLLLFAFDEGPLSSSSSSSSPWVALHFVITAAFPFKIKQNPPKTNSKVVPAAGSIFEALNTATLLALLMYCFNYKQCFHKHVLLTFFYTHSYLSIRLLLAVGAIPAQVILGVEIEPQFKAPVLSTSLQDFWGRRWNLRVSEILRATVYSPIRRISTRIIGARWASLPAVFVTFTVSGLMHEVLYYHITRETPTWDVTRFFVLHGVFIDMEIVLKKKLVETNKFRLHKSVSRPLTLANLTLTGGWLSIRQILRNGKYEKIMNEFNVFVDFLKVCTGY